MVKEKAFAKANLFLDIVGKRPDEYHNLEMVMAPTSLYDTLTFQKTNDLGVHLTTDRPITEKPEENLVVKIAQELMKTYQIDGGVKIDLKKRIPIAAGLGGGSADGAATLRGMNRLFKLKLPKETLAEIGESFGSDIPYCIYNQLCIARGKGEQLFFLKGRLNLNALLITPPVQTSTKSVLDTVDMAKVPTVKITGMTNALYNKNRQLIMNELYNAFEPFTLEAVPEVRALKKELEAFDVDGMVMSGTGGTFVVFPKDKKQSQEIIDSLDKKMFAECVKIY